jgi:predicted NAD-dependent protein-ADP-ribosyltransferase YbiA (DUF1768 family)
MPRSDTRDIRSRSRLIEAISDDFSPEYLLFWGHTPPADGRIGRHVLSQWWPAPIHDAFAGHTYLSAEHYMMAEKARLFGDEDARAAIVAAATPAAAKALGRKVRGFNEQHRVVCIQQVVAQVLALPELRNACGAHDAETLLLPDLPRGSSAARPMPQIRSTGLASTRG